jgi:hypothetical protein
MFLYTHLDSRLYSVILSSSIRQAEAVYYHFEFNMSCQWFNNGNSYIRQWACQPEESVKLLTVASFAAEEEVFDAEKTEKF